MKFLSVLKFILGESTNVLPLFIHNPKSQAIEGIVLTEASHALAAAQGLGVAPSIAAAQGSIKPAASTVRTLSPARPLNDQSTTGVVDNQAGSDQSTTSILD